MNKVLINISIQFFVILYLYSVRYKTRVFVSNLDIRQDSYQDSI